MTHKELVEIGAEYMRKGGKLWTCPIVFTELVTSAFETPDVIGFYSGGSTLIEVKCSRSDFKKDKQKIFRKRPELGMGSYRFYLCEAGLIAPNEIPDRWGLLNVLTSEKVELVVKPSPQERNIRNEQMLMYSALRRLNDKDLLSEVL